MLPGIVFALFNSIQEEYKPLPVLSENNDIDSAINNYKLLCQTGDTITPQLLNGFIYVADFFFTSCPSSDFCPRLSANMNVLQRKFYSSEDVRLVSFTVDPERDSVKVLSKYADAFFAKPNMWMFLTGNKNEIYELINKKYLQSVIHGDNDPDAFIHTDKFVLVDKKGRIRGFYNGRNDDEVKGLITDIKVLQQEYTHQFVSENKVEYNPNAND